MLLPWNSDARSTMTAPVYQLKATLVGVEPAVWRRIRISGSVSLRTLHFALQVVMGWEASHQYQFVIGKTTYRLPDPDDTFPVKDPKKSTLEKTIRRAPTTASTQAAEE